MSSNHNPNPEKVRMAELCDEVPDVPRHEVRRIAVKMARVYQNLGSDVVLAE